MWVVLVFDGCGLWAWPFLGVVQVGDVASAVMQMIADPSVKTCELIGQVVVCCNRI